MFSWQHFLSLCLISLNLDKALSQSFGSGFWASESHPIAVALLLLFFGFMLLLVYGIMKIQDWWQDRKRATAEGENLNSLESNISKSHRVPPSAFLSWLHF